MSADWYPGIRLLCAHGREASMLHETFSAMEKDFDDNNDACIDSAKAMVEVACRIIVGDILAPWFLGARSDQACNRSAHGCQAELKQTLCSAIISALLSE